uniref:ShKT domain-containing protein n=1 Tax=Strongyloides papillosus TaxID=174720 RepID=A0A0N5BKT0_STREA
MKYNYVYILILIILSYGQVIGSENDTKSLSENESIKTKSSSKRIPTHRSRKHRHHNKLSDSRKKGNFSQDTSNHETSFSIDSLEDQIRKPENLSIKTLKINDTFKSSKAIEIDGDVIENFEKPVLLIDEHISQEKIKKLRDVKEDSSDKELGDIGTEKLNDTKKENDINSGDKKKKIEKSLNTSTVKEESLKVPILLEKEVAIDVNVVKTDFENIKNTTKDLDDESSVKSSNKTMHNSSEVIFPAVLDGNSSGENVKTNISSSEEKIKIVDFEKDSGIKDEKNKDKSIEDTTEKNTTTMFMNITTEKSFNVTSNKIITNSTASETTNSTDILNTNKKSDKKVNITTENTSLNSTTSSLSFNKTDTGILKEASKPKDEEKDLSFGDKSKEVEKEVVKDVVNQPKSTFFVIKMQGNTVVGEHKFDDESEAKRFLLTTLPPTTTTTSPSTTTTHPTTTTIPPKTTHLTPPPTTTSKKTMSSFVPKGLPPSARPPNDEIIKKLNAAIDFIQIAKELGIFHMKN